MRATRTTGTSGESAPLRVRLRYAFDNTMAAGTPALMAWLAALTLGFILIGAMLLAGLHSLGQDTGGVTVGESIWLSLVRSMDPGTMSSDAGWPFRLVSLMVTLAGIFILSALIGLLSSGIDRRLEQLRRGRSPVVETGHTLILGWSPKLHSIISELVVANENQPRSCVVVMAPEDKIVMEDEIRARVPQRGRTKIVCRTGEPSNLNDLQMVGVQHAKSIVILSPDLDGSDAQVVRCLLALLKDDGLVDRIPVVAEFNDARNAAALDEATEGRISTVSSTEVIALITAQVCRQSGLSVVYQDLLDFAGDEIYFAAAPQLTGRTFGDALLAYDDSAVIGLRSGKGHVALNPPMDTVLDQDDQVIAISQDDDTLLVNAPLDGLAASVTLPPPIATEQHEQILVLGWNPLGPLILRNLDGYVQTGSVAQIIADPTLVQPDQEAINAKLRTMTASVTAADTTAHEPLRRALSSGVIDHIVILCYRGGLNPAEADARTLMTLLQVRQILGRLPSGAKNPTIATELLDVRDVELARVASSDDFVLSEELTSLMMAQLSENRELGPVFTDLLDAEGTDMTLRPAMAYVTLGQALPFSNTVRAARSRGEIAIGYRSARLAASGSPSAGVVLNPIKSAPVTFGDGDQIIVLTSVEARSLAPPAPDEALSGQASGSSSRDTEFMQ